MALSASGPKGQEACVSDLNSAFTTRSTSDEAAGSPAKNKDGREILADYRCKSIRD